MRQERSSYCLPCHAETMRDWRKAHPFQTLSVVARFKATVRSIANVYQRRGEIEKCPCYFCGAEEAEKHHPDYSRPLIVVWLCRKCHLQVHEMSGAGDDAVVERLAIQWDEQRKLGVKQFGTTRKLRKLHKQHMAARLSALKTRTLERRNQQTAANDHTMLENETKTGTTP